MIRYTVSLLLWEHDADDRGNFPIYIKITVNRKTVYISTQHTIPLKFWDAKNESVKSGYLDAGSINAEIKLRKSKILQRIVELQFKNQEFTAKSIKQFFTSGKDLTNIFNFIDAYCEEVRHKKNEQTILSYQKHYRKLAIFHGSKVLHFEDITQDFLSRYEKHLRELGAGNNYVHSIWKTLKTFFNAAKKKKLISHYPFDQYENPVYKDPQKDYLTLEELRRWEEYADTVTNPIYKQTAVYFLFGCYSGLRISDWQTFNIEKHVVNDKIKLRAKKNKEWITVPLSGPLRRNIERMKLLPLSIEEPTLNEKLKHIAAELKISKRISSHCGRKTFAVTMCADQKISSETCAALLGITPAVCIASYYSVTDYKINSEVTSAWKDL